ncbi:MAG TPA: FHA domain-containing protein [Phycisphaerae bacterium]|nr:FHA domain-containing protein [Phycisphaerae bacterium]HNU47001.1 FHA domain-containing protein [Phycisphaerae bacterium]
MAGPQESPGDFPAVEQGSPEFDLLLEAEGRPARRIACRRVLTLIGTRPGCKIVLKHANVAPIQVLLVNDGTRIVASDPLANPNTKLNGLRLEHEEVTDGDVLNVETWNFRAEIRKSGSPHGTQVFTGDLDRTPDAVALEHVSTGTLFRPKRAICVIGRRKGCDLAVSEPGISRVHCAVFTYLGRPAVADLLTENGTRVNDKQVNFRLLKNGDVISVGETRFRIHFVGIAVAEPGSDNGKAAKPTAAIAPQEMPPDLIDIQATESRERWRIAEAAQRARRRE